ncbi:MAG: putative Melibiose carrier protein [Promethearchaeota archaeon]|nr:MAG: putative Melibiose carrier protein [Candidatus Lokiarchaeota archaeon]
MSTTKADDNNYEYVPVKEKLAYAFATMPGTFYHSVMGLIQAFYYAWMGLQNVWIIIGQIAYMIWNAANDPLFGHKINNTRFYNKKRGEIQRYIPYIKYGAPLFSIAFAMVFFPPEAFRGTQTLGSQVWLFVWYMVSQIAYDSMFTLVLGAHVALLPQMTLDQKEREKIQIYSTLFTLPGVMLGFFLPLAFLVNPTVESIRIFQFLVIGIAIFGLVPYLFAAYVVREHPEHIPEKPTPLKKAVKSAFKNKSYLIYMIYDGVSVYIINVSMATLPFFLTWVISPMMNSGIEMLIFWIPPLICLIVGAIIELRLANIYSIKTALSFYQGVLALGFLLSFAFSFTGLWYLVCIGISIVFLAYSGDFILHYPMWADTIDYDLWKISGERREGLYAGIGPLISKPMISLAFITPTTLMTLFGLVYVGDKLQPTMGAFNAFLGVSIAIGLIPGLVALLGFIIWTLGYPLTGDIVKEMKGELLKIHAERRDKYIKELGNPRSDKSK